ncbi:MAG: hypothetical protein KC589_00635 [Nanoarchaeota archaeon]|nr:hypothetical protein [Nanoarchaeota archaeon]
MKDSFRIEMELEQKMCSNCKKSSTEYFELKLQLRFKYYKNIDLIKKEVFSRLEKNFDSINRLEELDNGFDIYFRSYGEMNKISRLFNKYYLCDEKRSKKLIGRDNLVSKDKYRYFQSIILINLVKGNKVIIKGEEFVLKAINGKDMVLIKEEDGSKKVISYTIVKNYFELIE